MKRGLVSVALFTLLLRVAPATAAGAASQRVNGTITDALGRPVNGASLVFQREDGHIIARTRSDRNGHFEFVHIRPGTYAIVANKPGFATATSIVVVTMQGAKPVAISMAAETALRMQVVAKRLDIARNGLSPETGGSIYRFTEKAIRELPQGSNTQINDVLLQAPGVAQDSFGALHIRGEHAEVQYRINGIELPEGVTSGFSQTFSPRFARSISLLEGALPAQYGYHTAGVVQIQTKSGESLSGGDIEMYGGQRGTLQPSFELGGRSGKLSYYTTGYYLQNNRGLEPPTPGPEAIHDFATIGNDFSYLSYFLSSTTRISLLGGFNLSNFEIPANPDQCPAFNLAGIPSTHSTICPSINPGGVPDFPSANIRETQLEQNYYGVLALQGLIGRNLDYQVAAFSRYSTLSFHPDQTGDLIYNGVASRVFRSDWANGLEGDFTYRGLKAHTIRAGYYFQGERAEIDDHALVFPGGPSGQTSDEPEAIVDNTALTSWLYGLYVQDEWKPIRRLTINYGVRFDLYDGLTRSDQASPRVGVVYQLFEKTALHAAYARYFTPPPLEAVSAQSVYRFVGTTNEPAVRTNSNIAPERAHYFDAGITQNLPYGLKAGLDSYYKKSRDLIDEGQFGPTLIFTPFNYDKGRQYGVEFTTSLTRENLTAYTNFAYSVAQGINIVSDQFLFGADELAYIKNHYVFLDHDQTFTASWGIAYNYDGFLFTLNGVYGSGLRSGFANTGNQPFYVQFDAGVVKHLVLPTIGHVEGRVAVVNLGDWIYQLRSGSGIGVFASQYGPRRTVLGGLKWFFPWSKPSALTQ
ncbi:MAG TPA: TonB-dependent receptor [Candidatus Binataceae bacterium]|nr:TonB-dependent receptor [Candidatus Binataceae bacterium]